MKIRLTGIKQEKATELAKRLWGLWGWGGMETDGLYAESGLTRMANNWLKKNNISDGTARISEDNLGDGISHYYPTWK